MPPTRRLRIEWSSGRKVTGLLTGPGEGAVGIVLAHGAGAGQRHPFMAGLRARLGASVPTLAFDYPYMEDGRRAPDRMERLLECHRAAADRLAQRVDGVVLAGKSMGGRVGGHVAAASDVAATAVVFYGYPLIPIGSTDARPTDHLGAIGAPILFIQGSRDRMGPPDLIGAIAKRLDGAGLEVIEDADHGFAVPKRTGLALGDVLDRLAGSTLALLESPLRPWAAGGTSPS